MRFPYSELVATYRVAEPFRLPHHSGSLLRGVLGRALRSTGCSAPSTCATTCQHPGACAYSRLFDPPAPTPLLHKLLRGASHAPQPLLPLVPAPGTVELHADESFMFPIRVLGHLAPADEQRLTAALKRVATLPLGRDHGQLAFTCVTHRGEPNRLPSLAPPEPAPQHATLTLETPAWIEHRKQLPTTLDFRTLFRALNRRVTTICALYGELTPADEDHFHTLDALCDEVSVEGTLTPQRWERHSLERDERHPMKGLLGSLALHGNLAPFVPLLRLAELAHVGKATSHGLGRIHVALERQGPRVPTIRLMVKEARRVAVTLAMDRHVGNITHAAKALGTSRRALREHLKAAGLYPWGGVAEGDEDGEEDGEARTGHAEVCTDDANVCTGDGKAHDGNGGAHVL